MYNYPKELAEGTVPHSFGLVSERQKQLSDRT